MIYDKLGMVSLEVAFEIYLIFICSAYAGIYILPPARFSILPALILPLGLS